MKNKKVMTKRNLLFSPPSYIDERHNTKWLNLGKSLSIISSIPAALCIVEGTIQYKWLNLGKGLSIISSLWIVEGPDHTQNNERRSKDKNHVLIFDLIHLSYFS